MLNYKCCGKTGKIENGSPVDDPRWFPDAKYRFRFSPTQNYLVPPDVNAEIIVPWGEGERDTYLNLTRQSLIYMWSVTPASWQEYLWNPRVVYENHWRGREPYPVLRRVLVPFTKMPKPSWEDFFRWEEDYQLQGLVAMHPSGRTDNILDESVLAVSSTNPDISNSQLREARAVVYDRIIAVKAPALDARGGLAASASGEEVRAARVASLNALYDVTKPEKLDAAILEAAAE